MQVASPTGRAFLVLCLFASTAVCKTADIVTMRDGTYYEGSIVAQDSASITLQFEYGLVRRIPLSNVKEVRHTARATSMLSEGMGDHRHDGFFLSASLGTGYVVHKWARSGSIGSDRATVLGSTIDYLDFRIGGAVKENLILSFDVMGSGNIEKRASGKGRAVNSLGVISPTDSVFFEDVSCAGMGITYYFMPQNVFVSGMAGLATTTIFHSGTMNDSSLNYRETWRSHANGFMLRLKVGKEWWVSKNLGLGVSGAYSIFKGREVTVTTDDPSFSVDPSYKGSLTSQRIALMVNATFN